MSRPRLTDSQPETKTIVCRWCRKRVSAIRHTKSYCSDVCASRHRTGLPRERNCRHCGTAFPIVTRSDANRQHCSKACAKSHNAKAIASWVADHPSAMKSYRERWQAKNPTYDQDKKRQERAKILSLLGGMCVVCGVTNPNWLHVDYIPTTRNTPYRHPRHLRYIEAHPDLFRLLCANHHYELTLTGQIEGTEITQ